MALELKQVGSEEDARKKCGERIVHLISDSLPLPTLLLISGGSCLSLLPVIQMELIRENYDLTGLIIGFIDERFDSKNGNFVTLTREYASFIEACTLRGVKFVDTSPVKSDQYEMAMWYGQQIQDDVKKIKHTGGKVIGVLGMGRDGHIAGILPFPDDERTFSELFITNEQFVVGYDATGKSPFPKRFTFTYRGIGICDNLVAYITGGEKKEPLQAALFQKIPFYKNPATFLKTTTIPCDVFTDISV